MRPFEFSRPTSLAQALELAQDPGAHFLAGGTNLVDLMKGNVTQPRRLIDISGLPLAEIAPQADGSVRIGALVRNADLAAHPQIRKAYPLLSQALLAGASPQLRNMATVGGNLLQRTRCYYFTDTSFSMCNKRAPGSGCGAREGYNRIHAIFGASEACVATNPSDMNVALAALDATVHVQSRHGHRIIPIGGFHRLPGEAPARDTTLLPGELITHVTLPRSPFSDHCAYLKVRDRASYAFALVSAAVALEMDSGNVRDCRVVLGGVAHKPWRSNGCESALRDRALSDASIAAASAAASVDARPLEHNAFKLVLAQRAAGRAIQMAAGLA